MHIGIGYYDAFLGFMLLWALRPYVSGRIAAASKDMPNVKIPWTVDVPTIHTLCVVRFHTAATGG